MSLLDRLRRWNDQILRVTIEQPPADPDRAVRPVVRAHLVQGWDTVLAGAVALIGVVRAAGWVYLVVELLVAVAFGAVFNAQTDGAAHQQLTGTRQLPADAAIESPSRTICRASLLPLLYLGPAVVAAVLPLHAMLFAGMLLGVGSALVANARRVAAWEQQEGCRAVARPCFNWRSGEAFYLVPYATTGAAPRM